MSTRVWLYLEKEYGELGAKRWRVEWFEINVRGKRLQAADPTYEIDFDSDLIQAYEVFGPDDRDKAMVFAESQASESFFGVCELRYEEIRPSYDDDGPPTEMFEWTEISSEEVHGK